MKDDVIKDFFSDKKQVIEDNGFSDKLLEKLEQIPATRKRISLKSEIIYSIFFLTGVILFIVFGGADVIITNFPAIVGTIDKTSAITPEEIYTIVFVTLMLFGVGKYAVEEYLN